MLQIISAADKVIQLKKRTTAWIPETFLSCDHRLSIEDGATWMAHKSAEAPRLIRKLALKDFKAKPRETVEEQYDNAVSVSQGYRSKHGVLAEQIVLAGYASIFNPYLVVPQLEPQEISKIKKAYRSLDFVFFTSSAIIGVSVTTKPQERKNVVWPEEAKKLHRWVSGSYDNHNAVFIAIMTVGDISVIKRKKKLFGAIKGEVACLLEIENHSRTLRTEVMPKL